MEADLDKPGIPRPSFVMSVEMSPRVGPVDANDVKKNLYGDFSSTADTSQRDSLESKERVHVCLRIRPFMQPDKEIDSQDCISVVDSTSILLKAPKSSMVFRLSEKNLGQMVQKFTFSQVFGPETTQEEFFEGTVKQPVQDFLKGHSRLIFTYGVTNAGKTYTYQGTDEDIGVLPRALDMLFKCIQGRLYPEMNLKPYRCREHKKLSKEEVKEEMAVKNSLLRLMKEVDYNGINGNCSRTAGNSEVLGEPLKEVEQSNMEDERGAKYSVWVSFCEIYNECIYDLLLPISNDKRRKLLRLAQDVKGCSYVKDLQWIQVSNSKEAFRLMKLGLKHQSFASTKLNANSSRSHSIFTVKMLKIDSGATRVMQVSELFLCDLAGSERCTRTCNEGERLKESGNINTSLHILGKCIHALKTSQQSKLQQHIPFRESKLTHFFQGFFSGKGKVCMIVNVSQSASAYDETLNVLKFSAIAQKVMVLDSSNSQAESLDQMSVKSNSELNTEEGVPLPVRRATMRWERTLEDVMEDEEELLADSGGGGVHEEICMTKNILGKEVEPEVIEEAISEEEEDSDVVMKKEDYQRLLNIVEDLKNKLIDERKDKLLLELRIREEVMQECSQYLAKKESDLRAFIDRREEMMEDNCEERIQIYKDLVKGRLLLTNGKEGAEETLSNEQDGTLGNEARESGNAADLVCMVESLQQNVTDIKQKAETVFDLLCASEDPQTTIELLGKQLAELTAELSKTREEVLCRSKEMKIQENKLSESAKVLQDVTEKMALQNKRIQELTQVVEQKNGEISRLQDLISHLETIIKDSEATIATIKQEMEHENSNKKTNCTQSESMEKYGRKRCLEREEEEEGPPAKQGPIKSNCKDDIETKKLEMQPREMVVLEEENGMQEISLATLGGQLEKEKIESEGFPGKINLSQKHVSSEERASDLSRELQQQQAYCGKIVSELAALKDTNKGQEEKIQALLKEMESASQTIAEKKSKVKAVEIKIGELSRLALQCPNVDVDSAHGEEVLGLPKEMLELPKERHEQTPINLGRKNSFHFSIENIWEVSKQIIHASAQKSNLIEDLRQQVGQLQRRTLDAEEEKHQLKLKLSETIHQVDASLQEKEGLLSQLRNLQQENALYSEKYRDAENKALGYLGKTKQMDGLLEECRTKEGKIACLEQTLKDKESAILVMERELKDMEGKLHISESETKRLHDQELQLKEQVLELRSNLKDMEGKLHISESETKRLHDQELQLKKQVLELKSNLKTIQLQDMRREESKQTLEQLNKELLESNALSSRLQIEVQRKDEEYADLKEKLADTKKQIEQVQRQVCTMRTEEKILRNKVNDLEKMKNQLTEELDIKQRTIQQFNKEELNKKLEDVSKQFQRACQDLCSKERIIEDMKLTLEEQEMTQAEQDQLLEAKLEESERLVAELEEWKRRCYELEKQKSVNVECRSEESPSDELKRLQEKLEEYEEQQKMDRKKWLAEKMSLISQVKEAETHRNREMKRFAGDREHHARQLAEAEKLVTEKENDLQKWRTERDQLVAALEVQLSSLVSSNRQKDQEIEDLKKSTLNTCGKDCEITVEECRILSPERGDIKELKQLNSKQMDPLNGIDVRDTDSLLQRSSRTSSAADIQIREQSETILDSCEVSAESEQTSRFPKPEMEIHFTPLQPNKMEVKHQGNPSVVTIKVPKAKKRKSSAMEEEDHFLKTENEKNATSLANTHIWPDSLSRQKKKTASDPSLRKEYSLRKKHCVSSIKSPGNAGGTLQKFGCFLQSSPTIIHSKAKKLMATIKSPKSTEEDSIKENDLKPKRAKRKLYSTDISSPMEFSGHVIVMDKRESDHEIIKRRLRAKKPH